MVMECHLTFTSYLPISRVIAMQAWRKKPEYRLNIRIAPGNRRRSPNGSKCLPRPVTSGPYDIFGIRPKILIEHWSVIKRDAILLNLSHFLIAQIVILFMIIPNIPMKTKQKAWSVGFEIWDTCKTDVVVFILKWKIERYVLRR